MEFDVLLNALSKVEKITLPGQEVQLKMAPFSRVEELKGNLNNTINAKKAGVMVLFYPSKTNTANVVLILRKTYKGVHSGQVALPGGKFEERDSNLLATAIRETEEEIGVNRDLIKVVKKMSSVYIPPSNYFVQPYLSVASSTPNFVKQEQEVEAILEINVSDLLCNSSQCVTKISTSYANSIEVPAFMLNGYRVWGATAMMLNEVKTIVKLAL